MKRPCTRGHGYIQSGKRCSVCERERDQVRGSRQHRGYDEEHFRIRRQLAETLPVLCAYGCGTWLTAESDWVAAHVEDGRADSPRVASCRRCNELAKRR